MPLPIRLAIIDKIEIVRLILPLVFSLLFMSSAMAQNDTANNSASWFDFWVGEWNLTWTTNGAEAHGKNVIERTLNDKVIQENFEALDGGFKGYIGKSWSVYNPSTKTWKQTWVDNQGGYLDFIGGKDGDRFFFRREAISPSTGKPITQRMVFYDITADSFMWDWESSVDNGKTWKLQWRIDYQRAKE